MSNSTTNGFPSQKKAFSQKTLAWKKQCVDYAETQSFIHNHSLRQSRKQKYLNYQLYNGIIDMDDLQLTLNPHETIASYISEKIPHYPIAAPKIDLLVGEELNRKGEYKVVVSNPDAISEKEEAKAELWRKKIMELVKEAGDKEAQAEALEKFDKYLKFDWQDIKEMTATNILRHYSEKQHFKNIFNDCFKDFLLTGEELAQCDIVSNEPELKKLNTLNVHAVRSSGSEWIQDSDLIVLEDYWSPGKLIDHFYDELKPSDIAKLEENLVSGAKGVDGEHVGNIHHQPDLFVELQNGVDDYLNLAESNGHNFGNYFDTDGNCRVLRVYWKSNRKVLKVKYYDEDGNTQYDYFPESYVPDKDKGEEGTVQWINEMWEGTKILDSIYLQMRPRPIQYNDINNPSKCHAGIIGLINSTNQFQTVSVMDRMKQYQYLYDVQKDRLNKALAKYLGPLLELDLASMPENWQMDKWLHFAYANGIATKDSFKEGNKGASIGKLAGNIPQNGRVINLEMGNYIQNQISFLEYIKADMAQIVGISPQREGAISNRETVGGVERSVNQSSHITEQLFAKHELFKAKVLECFLETAKVSFKTGNKKLQYVLGDESIAMLEVDDSFADGCYDVLISFNDKYQKLERVMEELAQAGMQNDKMDFSTLMSIYMSNSLSETRRAIELKEEDKASRDAEQFQQEMQTRQMEAQAKQQTDAAAIQQKELSDARADATKRYIAELQAQVQANQSMYDDDGLLSEADIDREELNLKLKELQQEDRHHKAEMEVKKMDIAAKKSKPASK